MPFLESERRINGASCANVFVIYQNQLLTPPLSSGALPGITRHILIELAQRHQVPLKSQNLSLEFLKKSEIDGLFLTNSLKGIHSAASLSCQGEMKTFQKENPLTEQIQSLYQRLVEKESSEPPRFQP